MTKEERAAYMKQRHAANKEKRIAANKEQRKKKQDVLREYKKNLICVRCGFSDYRAIEFHHRDPEQKLFSVSQAVSTSQSLTRIFEEIAKCDAICANCHAIEHYPNE